MILKNLMKTEYCTEMEKVEDSLWQKLSDSYYGRKIDPQVSRMSDHAATSYFWFIMLSELYVMVNYIIPHHYMDANDIMQYSLKVLCWFVFIQTVANWACVRYYDTSYKVTADRPEKTEDINLVVPAKTGTHNPQQSNGNTHRTSTSVQIDITDSITVPSSPGKESTWRWCSLCKHNKPPRTHHCIFCEKCILKRDHHCYMCGVCIGFRNQRYFVVLNFYVAIVSICGLYFTINYLSETFSSTASYSDYIPPVTCYRWLVSGSVTLHHMLMMFHVHTFWWTAVTSLGFFSVQLWAIIAGKTMHEMGKNVKIRCTSSVSDNFQSVFGPLWGINFIFPAQIAFRQHQDGIHWNNIKPL